MFFPTNLELREIINHYTRGMRDSNLLFFTVVTEYHQATQLTGNDVTIVERNLEQFADGSCSTFVTLSGRLAFL